MNIKKLLKDEFRKQTNREPKENEEINLETDALLLAKILKQIVEDHEKRILKLEQK